MGQEDKILILGAKGNLGGQLARVLGNEYRLLLWDKRSVDITNRRELVKKILEHKPNIIINAAAYNAVDKCEPSRAKASGDGGGNDEFELAEKINGEAIGYLADAAVDLGAMLIHYSSDYVFSGEKKEGYNEDDKPSPVNKYGESKLMGERELLKRAGRGLKYYLIRTSKLFGPAGISDLAKPCFFDIILSMAKDKERLSAVNGEISCFTYTPDLAAATKELIESDRKRGIYHIVNPGKCTWYEAARELFKLAGVKVNVNPVPPEKFPRPARRPKYSVLLNTKLKPLRNYKIALKEYLNSSR